MKKLIALMLALLLCLTLVACGGPDLEEASAAYTKASTAYNEVATYMNENPDLFGEEEVDIMVEMSTALEQTKSVLESGDATQEQADEAVVWFNEVYDSMAEIKDIYGIE